MLVSVIMPMRNAAPYVEEAISSVLQCNTINIELLVIDDGSTDNSREIVAGINDSRIRLLNGPQKGISNCLNVGIKEARGDFIMRCDADDRYPAGRIESQVAWLIDNPKAIAISGGFEMINKSGEIIATPFSKQALEIFNITEELLSSVCRTSLCTFCIKTKAVKAMHGFREYFETAEDIDFSLRLAEMGTIYFSPQTTYHYRIHNESTTHTQISTTRIFFEETAKTFASQRKSLGRDDLQAGTPPKPPTEAGAASSAHKHILNLMIGNAWNHYEQGSLYLAIKLAFKFLVKNPIDFLAWRNFIFILLKILAQKMTLKKHE